MLFEVSAKLFDSCASFVSWIAAEEPMSESVIALANGIPDSFSLGESTSGSVLVTVKIVVSRYSVSLKSRLAGNEVLLPTNRESSPLVIGTSLWNSDGSRAGWLLYPSPTLRPGVLRFLW